MNWRRVTKRSPCPVCGKPDWCMVSPDGKAALCARVESPRPAGVKGAGWLHKIDKPLPAPAPVPETAQVERADVGHLAATYNLLLSVLELSAEHRDNLRRRGLTDAQIRDRGYKTMPALNRRDIVARLEKMGAWLVGIPGFYAAKGHWQLAGPGGMLVPVRDIDGRIAGLQIRRDASVKNKYVWLSSSYFNGGSSPGAPVHVAFPEVCQDKDVWVTEGPLKADIGAAYLGRIFLAVPGVSNWSGVIPLVRRLQPDRVVIAFDMDKGKNAYVRGYLDELAVRLLRLKIRTFEADWNSNVKGIDDLCLEKHPISR